jgi:hypothetical protein
MATPSKKRAYDDMFLTSSRKLGRQLKAGIVTFIEYAFNLTLDMISMSDDAMIEAVGQIPPDAVAPYSDYLQENVGPVDYMPSPRPFIIGRPSDEEIEQAKRRLRPKYVNLHQLVKDRLANVAAGPSDSRQVDGPP